MRKELINEDWSHILYELEDGSYLLSVTCGRAATFSVDVKLTGKEVSQYHAKGEAYIGLLARKIQGNPESFKERDLA